MTYAEAAVRLGLSVEAVRQRAIRNRWARMLGNDKRARVRLPEGAYPSQTHVVRPTNTPTDTALVDALRGHIETLRAQNEGLEGQLAEANARADKAIAALGTLADRLNALAAAEARPWWRRLARG